MPITIEMSVIEQVGRTLKGGRRTITASLSKPVVSVELDGAKLIICEDGGVVFTMKLVKIDGASLVIDYPETKTEPQNQRGRGWGVLGALLCFYYGLQNNCSNVCLGTQMENTHESMSYWASLGIANMNSNALRNSMEKVINWVSQKCNKGENAVVFTVRDLQTGQETEKKKLTAEEFKKMKEEQLKKWSTNK